jgi:uncharacterized repeat protein (TIGR03803 family)
MARNGLTIDAAANLYGTSSNGGSGGYGTIFKLTHRGSGWVLTTLYSFTETEDGGLPFGKVIFGPEGILYWATEFGRGHRLWPGEWLRSGFQPDT